MRTKSQILHPKVCVICSRNFIRGHRTTEQWTKAKFCSVKCSIKSKIGVARPDAVAIIAKNRKHHKGSEHWNWKGGITPQLHLLRHSQEYNEWRKAVYARDYWTCQKCLIKQKHPIAHHIKPFRKYPKLRYSVENGMTLCRACHKITHSEIGMNTRFKPVLV